ncbi:MAG: hypothetical protein RLZZ15_3756 [Verrucomicrobiota bacterium]|jgi:exopolysaccharide biosynthesis polyprenyl glycosylphosphotransferase
MNPTRLTAYGLLALDLVAIVLVFNVVGHFYGVPVSDHFQFSVYATPAACLVAAIYLIEGYKARTDMLSVDYASQHVIALLAAMLTTLLVAFAFVSGETDFALHSSRLLIVLSFAALAPITLGYRRLIHQTLGESRARRALVFLGDRASCLAFRDECRKMHVAQPVVLSVLSEASAAPFGADDGEVLRPFRAVIDDVERGDLAVESIVLRESSRELMADASRRLVQLYFRGVPTYTLELFHQVRWQKIPLYRLNQTWLFQEGFQIAREPVFERLKRLSDIFLACVGLLVAAPLIALGALAVWLDDRGPVFFFQTRVGKNHAPFALVKLRTMRLGSAKGDAYTRPGDARITRVGRFLRASRLDELPQLWNVLRGDMSLIGPRAEWDRLVENYEREIPCYHFRHLVKPGITGWAQVNYPYGANLEDTERKLEYDLYYIRHFSFALDATIVLKTIHIMLFGKGR